jgi:tRNA nucleotidyltransferase/poly(A) polymerase
MVGVLIIPIQDKLQQCRLAKHIYAVGGCLRDHQLGISTSDFDFCVDIEGGAQEVVVELSTRFGGQAFQTGLGYPIWSWKDPESPNLDFQFADTQKEMFPDPDSRSRVSSFGTLDEDCRRRDFTINMIYWRIFDELWLDPSGVALSDLEHRILRTHPAVDPDKILSDDPLRILRLFRFWGRWNLSPSTELLESVMRQRSRLMIVSSERLRDELNKWIKKGHFKNSLEKAFDQGVLPEVLGAVGPQDFGSLEGLQNLSAPLQWAALLPTPQQRESVGQRLKWSQSFLTKLARFTELRDQWQNTKDVAGARRWYRQYFQENRELQGWLLEWLRFCANEELFQRALILGDPVLPYTTQDLLTWSGLTPGPELGRLKHRLLDWVEEQRILGNSIDPLAAQDWITKTKS